MKNVLSKKIDVCYVSEFGGAGYFANWKPKPKSNVQLSFFKSRCSDDAVQANLGFVILADKNNLNVLRSQTGVSLRCYIYRITSTHHGCRKYTFPSFL